MTLDVIVPPPVMLESTAYDLAGSFELPHAAPEEADGFHNVFHLGEQIVSGSEPEGEQAFRELHALGVKTILSVDGKLPEVELAAAYGMTYVHVPLRYSGIDDEQLVQITKTFREKEGPFYVHCFHGVHRGPAAAGIGRLVLDGVPREKAVAEMRQWCGTSPKYEALYSVVAGADIPSVARTEDYEWDFPSRHAAQGFRQAMVELTRTNDFVKVLQRNSWKPSDRHPDLDPVNETAKLADELAGCQTMEEIQDERADFRQWMSDSVDSAMEMRDAVKAGDKQRADRAFRQVQMACKACHAVYRN